MGVVAKVRGYFGELWQAWNRFWFTPTDPATLSVIRLLAGGLLLYTHAVWSLDLVGFLGAGGYTPVEFLQQAPARDWSSWSIFHWIGPTWLLWTVHILALVVFAMLFVGMFCLARVLAGRLLRPPSHAGSILRPREGELHACDVPGSRPLRSAVLP